MNTSGQFRPLGDSAHLCGIINNTTNSSSSGYATEAPIGKPLRIAVTSAYVIVFLISTLGNGLGLRIVLRASHVSSASCLLIGNKAFADLLTTLFTTPYMVFYVHYQNAWFGGIAGAVTCKLNQFPFAVSLAVSVFTIVIISVSRFFAVVYPLKRKFLQNPRKITAVIWALSVGVMSAPYLIPYRTIQRSNGRYYCVVDWGGYDKTVQVQKYYYTVLFVLMYVVPLTLTVISSSTIARRLWKRQIPGNPSKFRKQAARKANRQIAKVLFGIVTVFAIFWAPAHVMHYVAYDPTAWPHIPMWVWLFSFWLCHASCAVDPFLYIIFNSSFRKEVKRTFSICSGLKSFQMRSFTYTLSGRTARIAPYTNCIKVKAQCEMRAIKNFSQI